MPTTVMHINKQKIHTGKHTHVHIHTEEKSYSAITNTDINVTIRMHTCKSRTDWQWNARNL